MRATFGEDADAFPVFKVLEHGVVDTGLVHFPQFLKERGGGREGGRKGTVFGKRQLGVGGDGFDFELISAAF